MSKLVPREIAEQINDVVGGRQNIVQIAYCMTRLRLKVVNKVNTEAIKKIEGVMGVVEQGDQIQIILGPGRVNKVASELGSITGLEVGEIDEAAARKAEISAKNATPFKLFLKKLSNIFIPLIPAFIACGLVTAILNVVLKYNPGFANTTIGGILKVAGNAVFYGLNLFVGVNAAKEFGGSPMLGGVMSAIITHPSLVDIKLGGKALVPGRGGIIAVLLVVAFSSWLEKKLRKVVPEVLDLFITPLLVILISSFAAIFALQPLGGYISDAVGTATKAAISGGGAFTGFILGGTFLPLVMTGLHQGLTPIHADLLKTTGQNLLLPILAMAGAGQVGASIAVFVKTKSQRLKRTIASALPIGMMGVGEPLIYGVTLPLGKPFIAACIGGAFGGAAQAFLKVASTSMGLSGLPLAAITNKPMLYIIGLIVAYIAGFVATLILGFEDLAE
ncbi:PTS transporter subunit EIIC [Fonticella tunisiensis]|uniref:PTS system IIB component (Glc family) /PTS system IIC component (Glc family) n=1 Tax=Fonticella tunisiensis TaxID=1096341 RepID=A0A4R7KAX9_9CLOT|nr:PTS transporter subunit EIIC [Fonticella tunisiensis]TDT50944.1 PTS system IIB component (Glc family) /PTS system IIC component (Glc family) [Fonticella tunisiensis]